jgi:hypothetical protein
MPMALFAINFSSRDSLFALALGLLAGLLVGLLLVIWSRTPRSSSAESDDGLRLRPVRDPFIHGGTKERRTALRRKGTHVEVQLRDRDAKIDRGTGWVIDRSVGGLCVTLDEPIEEKQKLCIRPVKAPDTIPWLLIEVKSCRRSKEGRWELGCQFVRLPTWNVLMLFG